MPRSKTVAAAIPHFLAALEELVGPAVVLDDELRVLGATERTEVVLGARLEVGVSAPKQLCGHGGERPLAEAMAAKRAVSAEILRPTEDGENRVVRVWASPFGADGCTGWVLRLGAVDPQPDEGHAWGIVTQDPQMLQLLRDVRKVARSAASVLVRGETGSGKELIAHAIHRASSRSQGPFRAINCAALPPNLLESELFGHTRGAFTGAVRDNPGHFRMAEGGTLFLDEVAELPLDMQAKLLRVLQEKTVIPVGGREPVSVDVRIVSATHRALRQEAEAGRFRSDLLYRLRVIPLYLPPLRERPDDVELLARHVLNELESDRSIEHITAGALSALRSYPWPGNVRELQNAMEYASVMGEGPVLSEADLPPGVRGDERGLPTMNHPDPDLRARRSELPPEGRRVLNAIERAGGHMGRAASSLGMSRTTLWRKLKKYEIDRESLGG